MIFEIDVVGIGIPKDKIYVVGRGVMKFDHAGNIPHLTGQKLQKELLVQTAAHNHNDPVKDEQLPTKNQVSVRQVQGKLPDGTHIGHFMPKGHNPTNEAFKAANKLSVCVPQNGQLNKGPWSGRESGERALLLGNDIWAFNVSSKK